MISLPIYDPFSEIDRMFEQVWPTRQRHATSEGNMAPLDIFEKDGDWVLRASLPGVKPEDIDVQIEANVLTVRGRLDFDEEHKDAKIYRREIASGTFVRSVHLPEGVDAEKVEATFSHGLVTITIPRVVEVKPAAVKVQVKALDAPAD